MDTTQKLIELAEGVYVEEDVLRVVEKIREYDPRLNVKYNAGEAAIGEAPYMVVERCPDGIERIVFYVWELDDRILERLYKADNFKFNIADQIDADNARVRKGIQQRFEEKLAEANEITQAIARSPKDTYRVEYEGKKLEFTTGKEGVKSYGQSSEG